MEPLESMHPSASRRHPNGRKARGRWLGNDCSTAASVEGQGLATSPPRPPADSPALRRAATPCEPVHKGATDPELAFVARAWPTLPEPLKAAIVAMLKAAVTR
jgi:hypothetical protein